MRPEAVDLKNSRIIMITNIVAMANGILRIKTVLILFWGRRLEQINASPNHEKRMESCGQVCADVKLSQRDPN